MTTTPPPMPEHIFYAHELIANNTQPGGFDGIWLGCYDYDVLKQSHVEGETGAEIREFVELKARDVQWQQRITAMEAALADIGQYTGEGPVTTPWRDIVKTCGEEARTALEKTNGN